MGTLTSIEQRLGALEAQTLRLAAELAVLSWGVAEWAERLVAGMEQLRRAQSGQADALSAVLVRLAAMEQAGVDFLPDRRGAAHAPRE